MANVTTEVKIDKIDVLIREIQKLRRTIEKAVQDKQ